MTVKCWRMAGQGVGNDNWYEYFVCAENVSYQLVSGGQGQGLFDDGVRQVNNG